MPLHPSQWNGTVVRIDDDAFNIDTCLAFGLAPSAGVYGTCADAANDIMRAEGIGPITKWVDGRRSVAASSSWSILNLPYLKK